MSVMRNRKSNQTEINPLYDADEDYKLWWLILHMRRAMYRARARELFQYGITLEEATVLFVVQAIGR